MSCHHRVRDAIGGWTLSVNGLGGLALADIGLGMLSLGLPAQSEMGNAAVA